MITIKLDHREIELENVVLDFNGTIAFDGQLLPAAREHLPLLQERVKVFVLTADTFGSARHELNGLDVAVEVLQGDEGGVEKRRFVNHLGAKKTACIGNGANDREMFQACALSVIVVGKEGCSAKSLAAADIVVNDIGDAMNLLMNPTRIKATLRE